MPYSYEKPHDQVDAPSPAQPVVAPAPSTGDVRFKSTYRVDEETMRGVANCLLQNYDVRLHAACGVLGIVGIAFLFLDEIAMPIGFFVLIPILQFLRVIMTKRVSRIMLEREEEMQRQRPDVFPPVRETAFTDTEIVGLKTKTHYDYKSVTEVIESKNYVVLALRGGLYAPVPKANLEGGSVKEFKAFIEARRKAA